MRDPDVFPSVEVLNEVLGTSYAVFEEMMKIITGPAYGLVAQWNYYRDGKSWLCKVVYKKKTVFWLSVWDGYFRTGFYFTEKNATDIVGLDISESLKDRFTQNKSVGKLIPLGIQMSCKEQITDLLKIIEYKKSLK